MAGQLEQARDRVAVRAVASVGDVQRSGRIGRHHLDLHALRPLLARASVLLVPEDLAERRREPVVPEEEVDEAGPRDLGALYRVEPRRRFGDLGRDLAWRPPVGSCQA